jgi:hypothetical protein
VKRYSILLKKQYSENEYEVCTVDANPEQIAKVVNKKGNGWVRIIDNKPEQERAQ